MVPLMATAMATDGHSLPPLPPITTIATHYHHWHALPPSGWPLITCLSATECIPHQALITCLSATDCIPHQPLITCLSATDCIPHQPLITCLSATDCIPHQPLSTCLSATDCIPHQGGDGGARGGARRSSGHGRGGKKVVSRSQAARLACAGALMSPDEP